MPSNIAAVAASFKAEILSGIQDLLAGGDTLKVALYYQGSGLGYATTAYSTSGEISGAGYTAGGITVTNGVSPTYSGTAAYWTPTADWQWTGLTVTGNVDSALMYNASKSNRAIAVFTFPVETFSSSTFILKMPVNGVGTGLLQVS